MRNVAPSVPRGPSPLQRPFRGRPYRLCAGFLERPQSRPARAALIIVNLAAVMFFLLSYSHRGVGFGPYHIDLDVYRIGGRAWLRGGNLYDRLPPTQSGARLPFTYPPAAAVLLSPLSLVPMPVAATALTLGTVALLAVVIWVFLRRLAGPAAGSPWALAWLLPPALFLEPVRDTLAFGQVNVALMALVSLDCLAAKPRWPRGALTGLAAAVKLTPAAFVLFFLARRDRRAACTAAASAATVTAIGFAAAGRDSVRYWTSIVFRVGRAGSPAFASNQSILAVLARAGLDPHAPAAMAIWLALSAAAAAVACAGMLQAFAASEDCLALSLAAACVGLLIFAAAPQFWLPHGRNVELRWAAWQQITGSSYVIFAALILLLALSAAVRRVLWPRPWPGRLRPVRWAPGEQALMFLHLFRRRG